MLGLFTYSAGMAGSGVPAVELQKVRAAVIVVIFGEAQAELGEARREAARRRAEDFGWPRAVREMLAALAV